MVANPSGITILGLALLAGAVVIYYAVGTLYLAAFPIKSRYRGPAYEVKLIALFIKKHSFGLRGAELTTYEKNVDVAKNVITSVVQLAFSIIATAGVVYLFIQDPYGHAQAVLISLSVISLSVVVIALWQIRTYGSEKRIYDRRVPISPFARVPRDSNEAGNDARSKEKPIYKRLDHAALVANAKRADIKLLIKEDKRMVEERLSKSKFSKLFEISGRSPESDVG